MSVEEEFSKPVSSSDFSVATVATTASFPSIDSSASSLGMEDEEEFVYQPTSSEAARVAMNTLKERLEDRLQGQQLSLDSMKESFDLETLTQFYNELMIPNFPLEEERDDLEDWLLYLDPSSQVELSEDGPSMDVLVLRLGSTIIGGIAFEYYPQAHAGLLSYMVVSTNFRRLGILGTLHPVFCQALQSLHEVTSQTSSPIQAILAETNTLDAGDVPPEVARKRHSILYKLGYRLVQFPYVQPPLAPDVDSFDEIMLLVFVGDAPDRTTIPTHILQNYVLDFYHSVFGYGNEAFHDHWYWQLVVWYSQRHASTPIQQDLPWEDVTPQMKEDMIQQAQRK